MNKVFEALAHPARRRILRLLKRHDELMAGAIAEHFALSKPTLSHHLKLLTTAGLLERERRGQRIYYRVNLSVFEEASQLILDLLSFSARGATRPAADEIDGNDAPKARLSTLGSRL